MISASTGHIPSLMCHLGRPYHCPILVKSSKPHDHVPQSIPPLGTPPFTGSNPNPTHPLVCNTQPVSCLLLGSSPCSPLALTVVKAAFQAPAEQRGAPAPGSVALDKPLSGSEMMSSWVKQRAGDSARSRPLPHSPAPIRLWSCKQGQAPLSPP